MLIFLLFLCRAPAVGEGQAQGGEHPSHLPETARSLPLSSSFLSASLPPSLLNLLLPHLAPSGVPSCSHCLLSPPWEHIEPWGWLVPPSSLPQLPIWVTEKEALSLSLYDPGWGVERSTELDPDPVGPNTLLGSWGKGSPKPEEARA